MSEARRAYKALVARRSLSSFFNGLTQQYVGVYMVELGLSERDVGVISSLSSAVAALPSTLMSLMADVKSRRAAYLLGISLEALSALAFFIDGNACWLLLGNTLSTVSFFGLRGIENILIADTVAGARRAFAIGVANTLSVLSSTIAPLVAAYLIASMEGLSAGALRSLFLVQLLGLMLASLPAVLIVRDLRAVGEASLRAAVSESIHLLRLNPWLWRWVLVEALGGYVFSLTMPFQMIYAVRVKGADEFTLGYMGLALNLGSIISSPLAGKLADRIGRVRTILLLRPLYYASVLTLILAPSPAYLVLAFLIRGLFFASGAVFQTLALELVTYEYRGRWSAVRSLISMISRSPAPFIGGILYTSVAPEAPFLVSILVDLALRVPLIYSTPETLNREEYLRRFKPPSPRHSSENVKYQGSEGRAVAPSVHSRRV